MNTKHYIRTLKRNLKPLGYRKRKEIVKEIETAIDEQNLNYDDLIERFGEPEVLAMNYLDETETKQKKGGLGRLIKIILAVIGVIFLLIILTAYYFINKFDSDEFDYATHDAKTAMIEIAKIEDMKSLRVIGENQESLNLNVEQSRLVIYWDEDREAPFFACKVDASVLSEQMLVRQNYCYLIVPDKELNINSNQAEIIAIEPKNTLNLKLNQSRFRIAEKNQSYQYQINTNKSDNEIEGSFRENKDGILIQINAFQSKLKNYQYED